MPRDAGGAGIGGGEMALGRRGAASKRSRASMEAAGSAVATDLEEEFEVASHQGPSSWQLKPENYLPVVSVTDGGMKQAMATRPSGHSRSAFCVHRRVHITNSCAIHQPSDLDLVLQTRLCKRDIGRVN
eukprot:359593-Chlamydomonas_euryale.AAC.2